MATQVQYNIYLSFSKPRNPTSTCACQVGCHMQEPALSRLVSSHLIFVQLSPSNGIGPQRRPCVEHRGVPFSAACTSTAPSRRRRRYMQEPFSSRRFSCTAKYSNVEAFRLSRGGEMQEPVRCLSVAQLRRAPSLNCPHCPSCLMVMKYTV
jgi:hypothetical protein